MKSHLLAIMNRLNRLVEGGDPKETYNFEREGEVMLTVSYSPEDEAFALRYPKQKMLHCSMISTSLPLKFMI
ncbi:DUF1797 family protein [Lactococcus lactis]